MKKILLLLLALQSAYAHAQVVTVIDKVTRETLPGVVVSSKSPVASGMTSARGTLDISAFEKADTIQFKLMGYSPLTRSYRELQAKNFKVELFESAIYLSEITISSNRVDEDKIESPNRIEKLDMKEAAFQNPQTTADLLGTSGYAFIQKSQMGGGSPMLRGMATNRILLVVDGVRMNNAIFRAGNLQNVISLDANALESTEIFFGPGSVMYGSDAIGGVMNFRTLEPKKADSAGRRSLISGNALMRTSSANSEITTHADVNVALQRWAFLSSFTRSEYDDLRSGNVGGANSFYRPHYVATIADKDYMVANEDSALQVGSSYNQNNFMQKIQYRAGKKLTLDYGLHYSETSPYNRYDRLTVMQTSGPYKNKLRWAEWFYGPQKWNMNRVGINHARSTVLYDHLNVVAALQYFEESRYDREFMVRELRMQKETVRALSLNLDLDRKLGGKLELFYGGEMVKNKVGSYATLTHVVTEDVDSTVTRYPDGSTWASAGIYLSAKYKLHRKFLVNAGVRYNYYQINADFDTTYFPFPFTSTKMSSSNMNGSLGFVYTPFQSWQIYLNGATGFRAPNIDDMGKVFESTPGYLVVPNPNLKPEHVYNAEIGTVKAFGSFFKFDLAAYYTLLEDAMERKDYTFNGQSTIRFQGNKSNIQAVQNVARAYVYGVQSGFELFYKGFGIKSTFSYQYGKEQSPDSLIYYPLRHAAPLFGSVHLTYLYRKVKLDFYTLYNGRMDYEDLALTERVNPSYARDYSKDPKGQPYVDSWYTLNFKLAFYANEHIAVTLGVENIENRLYRPYSSGINAPGRNYIVALRARF